MLQRDQNKAGDDADVIDQLEHIEKRAVFDSSCFKYRIIQMVHSVGGNYQHGSQRDQQRQVERLSCFLRGFGIFGGQHQPERTETADAGISDQIADLILCLRFRK